MANYPTTPSVIAFQYELACQRTMERASYQCDCTDDGPDLDLLKTALYKATLRWLDAVAATQAIHRAMPDA
nr:hypothetical protein [uncultured Dongia sp.]